MYISLFTKSQMFKKFQLLGLLGSCKTRSYRVVEKRVGCGCRDSLISGKNLCVVANLQTECRDSDRNSRTLRIVASLRTVASLPINHLPYTFTSEIPCPVFVASVSSIKMVSPSPPLHSNLYV